MIERYPALRRYDRGLRHRFDVMPRARALAFARRGTATIMERADDYAFTYAPYIRVAVRDVGHNYTQVAKWLTRERIPAQRNGTWAAQSVKNLAIRYQRLTGRRILVPYKIFPTPARRKDAPPEIQVVPWEERRPGVLVRIKGFGSV